MSTWQRIWHACSELGYKHSEKTKHSTFCSCHNGELKREAFKGREHSPSYRCICLVTHMYQYIMDHNQWWSQDLTFSDYSHKKIITCNKYYLYLGWCRPNSFFFKDSTAKINNRMENNKININYILVFFHICSVHKLNHP